MKAERPVPRDGTKGSPGRGSSGKPGTRMLGKPAPIGGTQRAESPQDRAERLRAIARGDRA